MGKKKAIKIATATALAASTFAAVAPTQADAATVTQKQAKKAVDSAVSKMKTAYTTYKEADKVVKASTVQKKIDAANKAKKDAEKKLKSYKGKDKSKLQKKLKDAQKYVDRANQYVKAYNANYDWAGVIKKALNGDLSELKKVGVNKKNYTSVRRLNNLYSDFNSEIKAAEKQISKVYGKNARKLLTSKFVDPGKKQLANFKDVSNAAKYVEKAETELEKASANLDKVEEYLTQAGKYLANVKDSVELKAQVANYFDKIQGQYEALVYPAVESVTAIDETTVQVKLKTAKADLTAKNFKVLVDGTEVTPSAVTASSDNTTYTLTIASLDGKAGKVSVNGAVAEFDFANAKVVSVSAINATQVVVKFNKPVDKSDAINIANYSINTTNPAFVIYGEDKKSVTLTFASAASVEVTNATLTVNPIKLADDPDKTTAKYTQVFTYKDTEKPDIASVVAKTNGSVATSVTVVATEPISFAVAKIDGSYVPINFNNTNTATITGLNLDASKEHTIELINLTDRASTANVTVSTSKTFNVTIDTIAPTVSLSTASEKEILLTFSKPMKESTLEAAFASNSGKDLVKDESLSAVQLASYGGTIGYVNEVPGSNGTQFTIKVSDTLFTNKTSRTLTVVIPETVTDDLGNKIALTTQTVTLTKDTTKPVPTGYKLIKNASGEVTAIEVYFSEGLAANATPTTPSIVNMNGVDVTATFLGGLTAGAITAGDKKVTFTASTPAVVTGKFAFSFNAGLVSDLAETPNTSDAFNYTIDFGTNASTFKLANVSSNNNVIEVDFGRSVRGGAVANSATDINNYTLGGKPLPQGTTIVLDSAQQKATIKLPNGSISTSDDYAIFTVANVMSLNGEMLETHQGTVEVVDNVQPELTSAQLTADNRLVIGFSEAVSNVTKGDFEIIINGKALDLSPTGFSGFTAGTGSDAGKYVADLSVYVNYDSGSDQTFIDADLDGTLDADEVIISTGDTTSTFKFTSSPAITSFKVGTKATGTLSTYDSSTLQNKLKNGTVITIK